MRSLKSVSNRAPSNLDSSGQASPAEGDDLSGSQGTTTAEETPATDTLIVRGRSDSPLEPHDSGFESVIDEDGRKPVPEPDSYPWRMICSLEITGTNGTRFIGSGWFINSNSVATAGHCVYDDKEMGGWASSIRVIPGRIDSRFPYDSVEADHFSASDAWVDDQDPDFDIGCIHLRKPLGKETGWFAAAALPPESLKGFLVNVAGYPSDLEGGTRMFHHHNRILRVSDRRMFYDTDTFGGQSGAPVWIQEAGNSQPIAVGIHAYGTGQTPGHFNIEANSAPRLTPEVLQLFIHWMKIRA